MLTDSNVLTISCIYPWRGVCNHRNATLSWQLLCPIYPWMKGARNHRLGTRRQLLTLITYVDPVAVAAWMGGRSGGVARRENPGAARAEEDERTEVGSSFLLAWLLHLLQVHTSLKTQHAPWFFHSLSVSKYKDCSYELIVYKWFLYFGSYWCVRDAACTRATTYLVGVTNVAAEVF